MRCPGKQKMLITPVISVASKCPRPWLEMISAKDRNTLWRHLVDFIVVCHSQVRGWVWVIPEDLCYSALCKQALRVKGTGGAIHLLLCLWTIILVSLSEPILVVSWKASLALQLSNNFQLLCFIHRTLKVYKERLGLLGYPHNIFVLWYICVPVCEYVEPRDQIRYFPSFLDGWPGFRLRTSRLVVSRLPFPTNSFFFFIF